MLDVAAAETASANDCTNDCLRAFTFSGSCAWEALPAGDETETKAFKF